jgi:hypothetical protein
MKEVKTNNGIKGGFLKGKPHYDSEGNSIGGIKAVVTDQGGKPVELEGNEVIINKKSVQSKKELTIKGTPKQILSTINQLDGNGVAIGDEEAEILAKYKTGGKIPNYHLGGDMSKHLAPNNAPSNLTHEQWHLVRTPEFKAWFGDWEEHPESSSKVVDENGEPLVVYHGSKNKFTVFDNSKIGMNYIYSERGGFFFTQKKITAVNYAKLHSLNEDNEGYLYECFLDIKNPSISETNSEYRAPADYYDVNRGDFLDIFYEDEDEDKEDGIIIFGTKKDNLYVASKSNQIKLADGTNISFDSNNDDIRYKRGGNIGKMTKLELKKFYASPEGKKLDAETYSEWERLVNMTKSELQDFYNSKEGKQAGLSSHEAKELGIDSGRTSARWIMKMKDIPYKKWNDKMWMWAKKQISFIKRMSGMRGDLYDEKGTKTPKHTSLLIWGHNPERKFNLGGAIDSSILINGYVSVQKIYVSENLTEEICLITYNSGGQSNLNVNDTMNATEMLKLFVDELDILSKNEFMQIIYDHRFNSNRIDSPEELDYYKNGFKTVIVDRDRIEFTNVPKKLELGGGVSSSNYDAVNHPTEGEIHVVNENIIINNNEMDEFEIIKEFGLGGGIESEMEIPKYALIDDEEFEVIGVNYKLDLVRAKNFASGETIEMPIEKWIIESFELGTQAKFKANGREYVGMVTMKDGQKSISLYKDENYSGDAERVIPIREIHIDTLKPTMKKEMFEGGGEVEAPEEIEETIVEKFKPYKTVDELSELHKVPVSEILDQLHIGEKVEMEHTNDYEIARIIALQHIEESPKYYTLLDKMEQSFELGGELKMNTGGEIEFKPITTPL